MFNPYNIVPIIDPDFDTFENIFPNDPVKAETAQDWSTDGYAEPLERWHDRAYEPQRKAVRLDGHWR